MAKEAAVQLADGVWRIPTAPGDMINSFALVGSDGVTLVDAGLKFGPSRRRLLAGLHAMGAEPEDVRRIVVTHAHQDHAGGLAALVGLTGGAAVLAHERESVYLRDGRTPRTAHGSTHSFPKVAVTDEFRHGELLPGGLRAVHTPGHSPGHTALLHEESGVLITGDAVMNLHGVRYTPAYFCTDPGRNRQSADRLGELDFEVAAFAHGPELRRDARAAVRKLALGSAR